MDRVFLACRKADESGHQHFCSTEPAMVSSQRAAAGEPGLEVFLEMLWMKFGIPLECDLSASC